MCVSMYAQGQCRSSGTAPGTAEVGQVTENSCEEILGAQADLVTAIVSGWSCGGFWSGGWPSTEKEKFPASNIKDKKRLVKID